MGGSRSIAIGLGALGALAAMVVLLFVKPDGAAASAQSGTGSSGLYVGVATCGGTTCHGRSEGDGAVVRQDEIRLWQDPSMAAGAHSRAFAVLREPRSRMIAQRLGIGDPAAAPMCLGCHATPAPPAQRGPRFQLSDGVGCEACHGAAGPGDSRWLQSHRAVGATHDANVARGLVRLDEPRVRAGVCLDCHFGSAGEGQFVTHRIMAAGHPRISFELDLFTTLQQHHNEDADYHLPEPRGRAKRRADPLRTWAVGQAMALDRSLSLYSLPARGTDGIFPEFYFFDCHSCHRRISDDPNARPTALANPGRPIPSGMPPYNDENMIMLAAAARAVAPQLAQRYERDARAFHQALARDRASAVTAAQTLRQSVRALADAFAGAEMGAAQTFAIVEAITSEAISPRFTDYAGSVQAVMAVDTLLTALVAQGRVSTAAANDIRIDINAAYRAVRDPNAYDAGDFRASLGRAAAAIRRLR